MRAKPALQGESLLPYRWAYPATVGGAGSLPCSRGAQTCHPQAHSGGGRGHLPCSPTGPVRFARPSSTLRPPPSPTHRRPPQAPTLDGLQRRACGRLQSPAPVSGRPGAGAPVLPSQACPDSPRAPAAPPRCVSLLLLRVQVRPCAEPPDVSPSHTHRP